MKCGRWHVCKMLLLWLVYSFHYGVRRQQQTYECTSYLNVRTVCLELHRISTKYLFCASIARARRHFYRKLQKIFWKTDDCQFLILTPAICRKVLYYNQEMVRQIRSDKTTGNYSFDFYVFRFAIAASFACPFVFIPSLPSRVRFVCEAWACSGQRAAGVLRSKGGGGGGEASAPPQYFLKL